MVVSEVNSPGNSKILEIGPKHWWRRSFRKILHDRYLLKTTVEEKESFSRHILMMHHLTKSLCIHGLLAKFMIVRFKAKWI